MGLQGREGAKAGGGGGREGRRGICGRVNVELFVLFSPLFSVMSVQLFANACDDANCGLVAFSLVLQAFRLFGGFGAQVHHLSSSTPRMALSTLQEGYV